MGLYYKLRVVVKQLSKQVDKIKQHIITHSLKKNYNLIKAIKK